MKDLDTISYNETAEKLVKTLCKKTQSNNHLFFHILVGYYFAKVASMMRASIDTHDRGVIPVNLYAVNLAPSGQGKGHSTNIVEEMVINQFKDRFLQETFPLVGEKHIKKLALKQAQKNASDPDEEIAKITRIFEEQGKMAFSFDSGTTAAVKQMRIKLLMAAAGSMNMEIDEIGSNLMGNVDVLTTFLELYDIGKVKQKLTKNTAENTRVEELEGITPTNMMLFGTPTKLFDGGKTEAEFISFLETGYARRCLFGYQKTSSRNKGLTASEVYDVLTNKKSNAFLQELSTRIGKLANALNMNKKIRITKDVSILLLDYKLKCEERADDLPDHMDIQKAELAHRYFKALKLAGAYAFIDDEHTITEDLLYNAIKLIEVSGEALQQLLTRDRPYVKLANYIATIGREVTHVDLVEDLPFYKGSEAQKRELMNYAISYGYQHNIIIKKMFNDGIEFLRGEALQETNLDKTVISYGQELAANYNNEFVPFDKLHQLTQLPNYHWVAHHLIDNYRTESNAIPGFNLVTLDVDDGVSIDTVKLLLKEFKYLIYTTKSHTKNKNRFRIILPLSHTLKLDAKDYRDFMSNIYEWLPFDVDTQTNQRARKWQTHDGKHFYNDGELLDALLFIPKTTKNEERKKIINDQQSLSNIERWFVNNTGTGNRSNQMIRYALMLVDSGMNIENIKNAVLALNNKLQDKMEETEILGTILVTAGKAIHKRDIS